MQGAWSMDMFNDLEAASLVELVLCLTDHEGDTSWSVEMHHNSLKLIFFFQHGDGWTIPY